MPLKKSLASGQDLTRIHTGAAQGGTVNQRLLYNRNARIQTGRLNAFGNIVNAAISKTQAGLFARRWPGRKGPEEGCPKPSSGPQRHGRWTETMASSTSGGGSGGAGSQRTRPRRGRCAPAGIFEDQQGDGTDADPLADFGQTFVHGLDADCRDDQCGAGAARMLTFAHPYIMDKEAMDKEAARRGQSDPGEDCIALLAASLSQYSFAFNTSTPRKGEGDCVSKGEAMPRR
jgi:hypothetical protein